LLSLHYLALPDTVYPMPQAIFDLLFFDSSSLCNESWRHVKLGLPRDTLGKQDCPVDKFLRGWSSGKSTGKTDGYQRSPKSPGDY
jgi:hypothetical protein